MDIIGDIYGWFWTQLDAFWPISWVSFSLVPLLFILLLEVKSWLGISAFVRLQLFQKRFAEQAQRLDKTARQLAAQAIRSEKEVSKRETPDDLRKKLERPFAKWLGKQKRRLTEDYSDALGSPVNQLDTVRQGFIWPLLRYLLLPLLLWGAAMSLLALEEHTQVSGPVALWGMDFQLSPLEGGGALAWTLMALLVIRFIPGLSNSDSRLRLKAMGRRSMALVFLIPAAVGLALLYAPSGVLWIVFMWGLASGATLIGKQLWFQRNRPKWQAAAEAEVHTLEPPEAFFVYETESP